MLHHNHLINRFEFRGYLLMESALHIGTGLTSPTTDAGVVRDFQGRPFIPGSSLKGALRSAIERRVEWLGLRACYLENGGCFGHADGTWRDRPLAVRMAEMDQDLCDVCKVFGASVMGGKVQIDDLPLEKSYTSLAASLVEMRDGVGIDRDTGTAVDNIKFDYEVVPSMTAFQSYITAENLEAPDAALLALGLLEMINGAVPLGGKSTRGLGRCYLHFQKVFHFEFPRTDPLESVERGLILDYLKPPDDREHGRQEEPRKFLEELICRFLEQKNE